MRKGFSLVELSIVLVILGLLVGGILAGQSLIRAAELRSVSTDINRYITAYYAFRDKYFGVPGDFANATRFWTSAGGNGGDADCYMAQTAASQATCNGSNDGFIVHLPDANNAERFLVWKHLANAGLVEGSYTGRTTGAVGSWTPAVGTNYPGARIANGIYDWMQIGTSNGFFSPLSRLGSNAIRITSIGSPYSVLVARDAWNIDTKIDDGHPVLGRVIAPRSGHAQGVNCASAEDASATYLLDNDTVGCYLSRMMY